MMLVAVLVAALALLAFPVAAGRRRSDFAPSRWARCSAASLVAGIVLVELSLLLLAAPTVLHLLGVEALAAACGRLLGDLAPGGPLVGWPAFFAALVLPGFAVAGVVRALRAQRAMEVESFVGDHERRSGFTLVTLPATEPFAFAVDGATPQVVVSAGLRTELEPEQFDAVVRHEASHLRHRHPKYLLVAAVVEHTLGVLPWVRQASSSLRLAVERWADEDAAGTLEDGRSTVRLALLNVALLALGPAVAAFSGGDVLARVEAMEEPAASPRGPVSPYLALGAIVAVAAVGLLAWAGEAQMMLAMAGACPI